MIDNSSTPAAGRSAGRPGGRAAGRHVRRVRDALALRLPATLRGAAVDPALRGTLVLALVAVAGAAIAAYLAWSHRPVTLSTGGGLPAPARAAPAAPSSPPPPAAAARAAGVGASPSATAAATVVDVAGLVARPGVVTLPPGSRVVDAIEAAGGVRPGTDTTGISLARLLVDGEQILVDGRPGPAPAPAAQASGGPAGPAGPPGSSGAAGPVNLNTATADELDALPGVGPVLARRIVEWRQAHGGFTSAEQLGEVGGVGDKRLADLLPLVTVG
jgi:competence protein ComEA